MKNNRIRSAGRINLKDLAQELNLSKTTVSRALNGYPEVSETTRERVASAAKRLGYFPDKSAARLARGKVGAVGLIVDATSENFMEPILAEFLDGVGRELARSGTDLVIQPINSADPIEAYRRAIAQKTVDGFILNGPAEYDPRIAFLSSEGVPFVLHGRTKGAAPHCFFDIDNEGGFYSATRVLIDFGHKRVSVIGGFDGLTFTLDRLAGTRRALGEAGLSLNPDDIHFGPMTEKTGYEVGKLYFEAPPDQRPSAFLCMSLFVALGLERAAREVGASIPGDLSVIVHDDRAPYLRAEWFDPPLTAIQSSIRAAGGRIARMLADQIDGRVDPAAPTTEVVPVDLYLRKSVGLPKG